MSAKLTNLRVKQHILENGDGTHLSVARVRRFFRRSPAKFDFIISAALKAVPKLYGVSENAEELSAMADTLTMSIVAELDMLGEDGTEPVRVERDYLGYEALLIAIVLIIVSAIVILLLKGDV